MNFISTLTQNPIVAHSFRKQFTDRRMLAVFGLAALIYLCPGCFMFNATTADHFKLIFRLMAILLTISVTLAAPLTAVGAIAGEKERQTLDLLLITLLPARSIVTGKLVAASMYSVFLIAAAWPMILLSTLTGGATILELIILLLFLLTTAIAFTAIGLFTSSLSRTATTATLLTYGLVLPSLLVGPYLIIGPVLLTLYLINISSDLIEKISAFGLYLAASLNPLTAAVVLDSSEGLLPPWIIYIIFYSLITWFLIWLAGRRLASLT